MPAYVLDLYHAKETDSVFPLACGRGEGGYRWCRSAQPPSRLRTLRVQGLPQSLSTWVFGGDSHVFAGIGDSAQGLTQWVSLKRGLFEVHLPF